MASVYAKLSSTAFAPELLERTRETRAMKGLGSVERYENLKNAFAVSCKNHYTISGKRILVIDDIYTTGATTQQCSKILKQAGVSKVTVLSLASGRNQRPLKDISFDL